MSPDPIKLPPGAQLVDDQPTMKLPPGAELVPDDSSSASSGTDFTSNPGGEGLYRMMPADVKDYTDTLKEIQVPFSKVNDALGAGLHLHPDEEPRYAKDAAHQGEGPTLIERATAKVHSLLQPSTGIAGKIPILPGVDVNAAKAAGRVVAGLPEFAKDLASAYYNVARGNADYRTLLDLVDPGQVPTNLQQQFHEDIKTDPSGKLASDNLIGTMLGMGLLAKAPEIGKLGVRGAAEAVGLSSGKPAEVVRNEIRDTLGVWKNSRKVVESFGAESEKVRNQNTAADEANARVTQEHETKVREAHAKHVQALVENIQENLHTGRTNAAAKAIPDARQGLKDQIELDSRAYDQKIADAEIQAKDDDDAAWGAVRSVTSGKTTDINPLKKTVETAKRLADPATSAIFNSILREGEEESGGGAGGIKRDKQGRPIINGQPRIVGSDAYEFPVTHPKYAEVYKSQYGEEPPPVVEAEPPVAARPVVVDGKEIPESDPNYGDYYEKQYGEPPPVNGGGGASAEFNRLHRWYTYLSNRLYGGGRLEAGTYNSLKMVLNGIDAAMADIANQAGNVPDPREPSRTVSATSLLKEARKIHTERMETFSDSPNQPQTVASKSFSETTPEAAKEKARAERLAKLARYDPSIPALAKSIDKWRKMLAGLPSDKTARAMVKPATEPPEFENPEEPKLKEKDEPPETPNLQAENAQFIADRLREFGKWGQWVVRLLFGGGMAVLMKGKSPEFGGDLLMGSMGVNVLTHALRAPRVLDWLAKPSAEDIKIIASLPTEDAAKLREALGKLAEEEREKDPSAANVKIAPIMAAWLAGGKAAPQPPNLPDVKKKAEEIKPASPPGPQSSTKSWTHEFDPVSGNIVAA